VILREEDVENWTRVQLWYIQCQHWVVGLVGLGSVLWPVTCGPLSYSALYSYSGHESFGLTSKFQRLPEFNVDFRCNICHFPLLINLSSSILNVLS